MRLAEASEGVSNVGIAADDRHLVDVISFPSRNPKRLIPIRRVARRMTVAAQPRSSARDHTGQGASQFLLGAR
jgi:hypothetical protein